MGVVIFGTIAAIWVALLWFYPWGAIGIVGLLVLLLLIASVQIGVFVGERPKAEDISRATSTDVPPPTIGSVKTRGCRTSKTSR